jgi:hypothetical protein
MHAKLEAEHPVVAPELGSPFGLALIGLAAGTLLLLRVPDVFRHPQFWAEDGGVFFQQQMFIGFPALWTPFAGYLHLVPRLTALVASAFPSRFSPGIYNYTALVFTVWSAVTIGCARYRFAWLGGLLLVAIPHWWGEVFGTITNIQWLLAPALAVVVATPSPVRPWMRRNQIAFAVCSALSGPFSIFALPLCAGRLWTDRDRHSITLVSIVAGSAAVQITATVLTYEHASGASAPLTDALAVFTRWFGTLASGYYAPSFAQTKAEMLVMAAYALSLLLLRDRVHLALLLFSGIIAAAAWFKYLHGFPGFLARDAYADRYFYTPHFAVIFAIACLALSVRLTTWARMTAVAALGLIAVNMHDGRRNSLPRLPWAELADRVDAGEAVSIPINPEGMWTVVIPARNLSPLLTGHKDHS